MVLLMLHCSLNCHKGSSPKKRLFFMTLPLMGGGESRVTLPLQTRSPDDFSQAASQTKRHLRHSLYYYSKTPKTAPTTSKAPPRSSTPTTALPAISSISHVKGSMQYFQSGSTIWTFVPLFQWHHQLQNLSFQMQFFRSINHFHFTANNWQFYRDHCNLVPRSHICFKHE